MPKRAILSCLLLLAAAGVPMGKPFAAEGAAVALAPHRAVYDLKLAHTRGKPSLQAVRGRIIYEFSGNACEGYALRFRQLSELDNGDGRTVLSDLRATSWEEGAAKSLRFNSQSYLNDQLKDAVDGFAERRADGLGVHLRKPGSRTFDLAAGVLFPTEHVRRIIANAREGKALLEAEVYDGSESGDKVYHTLAVIGRPIAPDNKPDDIAAEHPALAGLTRWPVRVSYFDQSAQQGEQMPAYAIAFELYENGISRALVLDYNDFVLSGELTSLEIEDAKPCP